MSFVVIIVVDTPTRHLLLLDSLLSDETISDADRPQQYPSPVSFEDDDDDDDDDDSIVGCCLPQKS